MMNRYQVEYLPVDNLPHGDEEITDAMYAKQWFPNIDNAVAYAKSINDAYAEIHIYTQTTDKAYPTSFDWDWTEDYWLIDGDYMEKVG